jgi:L-glyceraldehyde 3-phosphate reductase
LLDTLEKEGLGSIAFSPLEQGILTSKYLHGIPEDSRAAIEGGYLDKTKITPRLLEQVKELNEIAESRNQSLAQMAIAWLLKDPRISSVLIGVSKVSQLKDNIAGLQNLKFSPEELEKIEGILKRNNNDN